MLEIIHDQLAARLDNIKRFNGNFLIKEETVSQHSYWVIFYTNLLLKSIFKVAFDERFVNSSISYDELYIATIRRAIHHDFDEALCQGDVNFPIKYHAIIGSIIKDALDKITAYELKKLESSLFHDELKEVLSWKYAVSDIIVKIADWLSLHHFLHREYRLGNRHEEVIRIMNLGEQHLHKTLNDLDYYCTLHKIPYSKEGIASVLNTK